MANANSFKSEPWIQLDRGAYAFSRTTSLLTG